MKKLAVLGLLALGLLLIAERPAHAWHHFKFGSSWQLDWSGGNNSSLWGLYRNGQVPEYHPVPIMPTYDYAPPVLVTPYVPATPHAPFTPAAPHAPRTPPLPLAPSVLNDAIHFSSFQQPSYYVPAPRYYPPAAQHNYPGWYGW